MEQGLRTRIVAWSFVPTMIVLAAVAAVMFQAYDSNAEELVIGRNADLTRLAADQLATELDEYVDSLVTEARIVGEVRSGSVARDRAFREAAGRLALFDAGMMLLDAFGVVVATEPARPLSLGQNWSDRAYFRDVLDADLLGGTGSVISDMAGDGPGGIKVVVIASPIAGVRGELLGVMLGMFHVGTGSTSIFYSDIARLRPDKTGGTYVVDSNNRLVYHTNTDLIGADYSWELSNLQLSGGSAGAVRTRDAEGRDIIASYAPVPNTSWSLVVEESWAAVVSSGQGYRYILYGLLALGVIVPTVIVAFGVRRIMEPIKDLTDGAQRIAGGDFDSTVVARTGDEIQTLAERFNDMASALKGSYASLEQRIEEVGDRTRELQKLEQLGRALIDAPPDASTLSGVLQQHVPGMFPHSKVEIRVFPRDVLARHPRGESPVPEGAWGWERTQIEAQCLPPGSEVPWGGEPREDVVIMVPVIDSENGDTIGSVCLSRQWRPEAATNLMPAVQSLAAQVASALRSARDYEQILAHHRMTQELAMAWRIQASFLPESLPDTPGWQVAATLKPARETSGDFYDFVPLPGGRLGIVIADVADKGVGAALYMALSRTLIRTYGAQYFRRPDLALEAVNQRLLRDVSYDMFVTVFYGVVDLDSGMLTYCNAGHDPPYLFRAGNEGEPQALRRTGVVLGMLEDVTWEAGEVQLGPGDALLLYTDGVTDSLNADGAFFGDTQWLENVRAGAGRSANEIQDSLLADVHEFVGAEPQVDDITLMVVARGDSS